MTSAGKTPDDLKSAGKTPEDMANLEHGIAAMLRAEAVRRERRETTGYESRQGETTGDESFARRWAQVVGAITGYEPGAPGVVLPQPPPLLPRPQIWLPIWLPVWLRTWLRLWLPDLVWLLWAPIACLITVATRTDPRKASTVSAVLAGENPKPYTLHPTPYTLHPTPYALHPKAYTLSPKP